MNTNSFNQDLQEARKNVAQASQANLSNTSASGIAGNMNANMAGSLSNNLTTDQNLQEAQQYNSSVGSQGVSSGLSNTAGSSTASFSNSVSGLSNDQDVQEAKQYISKTKTTK